MIASRCFLPYHYCQQEALDRLCGKTLHSSDATLLLGYFTRDTSIPTPNQSCKRTLRAVEERAGRGGRKGRPAALHIHIIHPDITLASELLSCCREEHQKKCGLVADTSASPPRTKSPDLRACGHCGNEKKTPLKLDQWLFWDTGNGSSPTAHSLLCFLYPSLFILLQPQPLSKPLKQPELNNQLKMAAPGHKQLFN